MVKHMICFVNVTYVLKKNTTFEFRVSAYFSVSVVCAHAHTHTRTHIHIVHTLNLYLSTLTLIYKMNI